MVGLRRHEQRKSGWVSRVVDFDVYLGETVFQLFTSSIIVPRNGRGGWLFFTFHGLFNSNPGGALGLSVCPRSIPVNLRSLSITASFSSAVSHAGG